MPPSGLQSYMDKHRSRSIHRKISITDAIAKHRKLTNQKPLLVVDGSCSRRIFVEANPEKHLTGGQFKLYKRNVDQFIDFFLNLDVKLVVFFDGCRVSQMRERWISRKTEAAERCHKVLDALDAGEMDEINSWEILLPSNIVVVIKQRFLERCEVKLSTFRECDAEIISYANEHNAMAVMSQDADFAVSQGSWDYWAFKDIDYDRKTAYTYDRNALASVLGLRVNQLPLFRTLIGNDYLLEDMLSNWYRTLRVRTRQQGFDRFDKFLKVAAFTKNFDRPEAHYQRIAENVLNDVKIGGKLLSDDQKTALLKSSLESYQGTNFEPKELLSEDTEWNAVLKETLRQIQSSKICPGIFDIMYSNIFENSNSWEDFRKTDMLPSGILWRPLRAKTYGILLRDCPYKIKIEEWICAQIDTMKKPTFVEPVPPKCDLKNYKLVDFWADEKDEDLIELSWKLFCETIQPKLPIERVRNLDKRILVSCIVLSHMSKMCNLSEDEIEAFLLVNILCSTKDDVSNLARNNSRIDTRALRLSTVFLRGLNEINLLLDSVGCVVERGFAQVWNIFDGELFQSFFNFSADRLLGYKKERLFVEGKKFIEEFEYLF